MMILVQRVKTTRMFEWTEDTILIGGKTIDKVTIYGDADKVVLHKQ